MCVASAKLSRATVDPMDWTSICVATLSSLWRMTFPTTRGDVFSSLGPTRAIVPLTDFKINKSWSLSYNPQQQQRQSLSGRARWIRPPVPLCPRPVCSVWTLLTLSRYRVHKAAALWNDSPKGPRPSVGGRGRPFGEQTRAEEREKNAVYDGHKC